MKKIILNIVLAALCLNFTVEAQSSPPPAALKIGDKVPDITINSIINYKDKDGEPTTTAKISDFKGKLVILDFWATWCNSCIYHFPQMFELQTKFKDQLQVLLVNSKDTRDNKAKVEAFFNNRKDVYQLTCAIIDTTLTALFPHKSIPHVVWIMNNKVVAITSADDVNQANITAILNNGKIEFAEKKDVDYNFNKLLFIDGNGGTPKAYIFRYVSGLRSSLGIIYIKDNIATRIYQTNTSVLHLYWQAYPEYRRFKRNQIIFDTPNPTFLSLDSNSHLWNNKHLYNYELTFPPQNTEDALKLMQDDLARYFDLSPHIQTQRSPCLVLKKVGNLEQITADNIEPATNIFEKDNSPKYLRNTPLQALISQLNNLYNIPVIDETGFSGKINLNLPADLKNEDLLRDSLKKQGFVLNRENRKLDFLIFSQNKTHRYKPVLP